MPSPKGLYALLPSTPAPLTPREPLEYEEDSESDTLRTHSEPFILRGVGVSETTAWKVFISTCILAIAFSAANLTFLSTSSTIRLARRASSQTSELKRPSVYLGLENVVFDPPYCRSRGTFPQTFVTYDTREGPHAESHRVHAPDDKMTLRFGGSVRAVVDFYVPDHGLENCTLSVRRIVPKHEDEDHGHDAVDIDVFLLPSSNAEDRAHGVFLDTLAFAPQKESTSHAFHCPSRSHVYFEWRCAAEDCNIVVPLEGVTSLTASAESLKKTGFRITQYEAIGCIPG